MGPLETISRVSKDHCWAHSGSPLALLKGSTGPTRDNRQRQRAAILGPCEILEAYLASFSQAEHWAHSRSSVSLRLFDSGPIRTIREVYLLGPSEQFGRSIYWAHSCYASTYIVWAHVGFTKRFGLFACGFLRSQRLYIVPLCARVRRKLYASHVRTLECSRYKNVKKPPRAPHMLAALAHTLWRCGRLLRRCFLLLALAKVGQN